MKKEDFEKITNSMQEKLGKENASLIADDLVSLITENNRMEKEISKRETDITKLKDDKEKLMTTNINLLQQIDMGEDVPPHEIKNKETEEKPNYNFKNAFDKKGRFKV